jgi:hypothetical protein
MTRRASRLSTKLQDSSNTHQCHYETPNDRREKQGDPLRQVGVCAKERDLSPLSIFEDKYDEYHEDEESDGDRRPIALNPGVRRRRVTRRRTFLWLVGRRSRFDVGGLWSRR